MGYFLPQEAVEEGLAEGVCGARGRYTGKEGRQIADDEASDKDVNEVKHEMINIGLELLRIVLARSIVGEGCR